MHHMAGCDTPASKQESKAAGSDLADRPSGYTTSYPALLNSDSSFSCTGAARRGQAAGEQWWAAGWLARRSKRPPGLPQAKQPALRRDKASP